MDFAKISEIAQNIYFWLVTVGVGLALLVRTYWMHRQSPKTTLELTIGTFPDESAANVALLKKMSCVVVDDKIEDFPIDFMRKFFSGTVTESSVSLNDAARLSCYDVIFLDVMDVVQEDPKRGGAVLIESIRRFRKDGIIISVSSKKYDMDVMEYFKSADIHMRKPIRAPVVEEQLLAHMSRAVGPFALARKIDESVLRVFGPQKLKSLARHIEREVKKSQNASPPDFVKKVGVAHEYEMLQKMLSESK